MTKPHDLDAVHVSIPLAIAIKIPDAAYGSEGSVPYIEGLVQLFLHGQWGFICSSNVNNMAAGVLCRMIGYSSGVYNSTLSTEVQPNSTTISLGDVRCAGLETNIDHCPQSRLVFNDCWDDQNVAIRCYGNYIFSAIILNPYLYKK